MRALRDYVAKVEALQEFAYMAMEYPLTQAVHVEPHPSLLLEWLAFRRHPWMDANSYWPFPMTSPVDPQFDFDWRPNSKVERQPRKTPLLARIHLCRERADPSGDQPGQVNEQRQAVVEIAHKFLEHFDISFEDRAITRLAHAPGSIVTSNSPGTVGGYLYDPNSSAHYGVTCAHVASQGMPVTGSAASFLGTCSASSSLVPSPLGQLCKPGVSGLNHIDAAVFEQTVQAPPATNLTTSMHYGSGQHVEMTGGASGGPHSYYFGSLGLVHAIDFDGVTHCFRDISSIRPLSSLPLPPSLATLLCPRARRGDSGAWITNVTQSEWYAMLIAIDGTEGFVVDASDVLGWARNALTIPTLRVH